VPALPFKLNQHRRHHIPKQKHRVTNWREYDASLRRRGSMTELEQLNATSRTWGPDFIQLFASGAGPALKMWCHV
jgi:hypothetical protein